MADVQPKRKLRGLVVIASDTLWGPLHPEYGVVRSLGNELEELHVLVLTKAVVPVGQELIHTEEKIFVYHVSLDWILFRFAEIWKLFNFHLVWQGVFRADFILSLSGKTAFIAHMIGRHYDRDVFDIASVHMLSGWGISSLLIRYALRHAKAVFVPGDQSRAQFVRTLGRDASTVYTLTPPVDMGIIDKVVDRYEFTKDHPQFAFFVSGGAHTMETVHRLIKVHAQITARFPRAGLVIIADESIMSAATRRAKRAYGVFVYPRNDQYMKYLKGTNFYLALSQEQDIDMMLITALALHVPAVAGEYGIAKELFFESRYAQFLCDISRVPQIVERSILLINDQYVRTEYGLNNPVVAGRLRALSAPQYAQALVKSIDPIVRPLGVMNSATTQQGPQVPLPIAPNIK